MRWAFTNIHPVAIILNVTAPPSLAHIIFCLTTHDPCESQTYQTTLAVVGRIVAGLKRLYVGWN